MYGPIVVVQVDLFQEMMLQLDVSVTVDDDDVINVPAFDVLDEHVDDLAHLMCTESLSTSQPHVGESTLQFPHTGYYHQPCSLHLRVTTVNKCDPT